MKKVVCTVVALSVLSSLSAGCAPTTQAVRERPKTTVGVGAGAVGGAVLGGLAGGRRGAIAGGLLGALAGGMVGLYLDEREKTLAEAGRDHGYAPGQGTRLAIETVRVNPAALDPGETVNVNLTYAVLTPTPDESVLVRESREIIRDGASVGKTTVDVSREGGTWKSTVPLTLPPNAPPGNYRVIVAVATEAGGKDVGETFFRVRP